MFQYPGGFPTDPHEDDGAIKEQRHENGECSGVRGGCWFCIDERGEKTE